MSECSCARGEKKVAEKLSEPRVVRLSHKEEKAASGGPSPPKKEKIKGFDYDKWDRFNVEEECKRIDEGKIT
jgi:hypothetical protein